MERDELLSLIGTLRNQSEDEEARQNLITQICDEVTGVYTSLETSNSANNELATANEQLRAANMKLFQKIGAEPEKTKDNEGEDEPPKKRSFNDLFNDKGEFA